MKSPKDPVPRVVFSVLLVGVVVLLPVETRAQRSGVVVHDSAGVRVTLSTPQAAPFATVSSRPDLSLGNPSDGPAAEFSQITGLVVSADGSIWVSDEGSAEIRVFDQAGAIRFVLGGRGGGPGEFQRVRLLNVVAGDTVVVADDANGRITYFSSSGERTRDRVSGASEAGLRFVGAFDDGDLLALRLPSMMVGANAPGSTVGEPIEILRWDSNADTAAVLGTTSAVRYFVDEKRTVLPIPFTKNGEARVVGNLAQVTGGSAFRLRVFDGGRLRESYGLERTPELVADLADQYLAMVRSRYTDRVRLSFEHVLEAEVTPRLAPAFDEIRASDDGAVWARFAPNYGNSAEVWAVFGPDRAHLGDVVMPDRFHLEAPLRGAVVGVWTDDLDVQHVRRYRLDRTHVPR